MLLHSLMARNKNQHRQQPWFAHSSKLTRCLARLLHANVALYTLRYEPAADSSSAANVRRRFEREARLEREIEMLEWRVREVLLAPAWAAATALVGDAQFAGVGLLLIGCCADVRGLVGGPVERWEVVDGGVGREVAALTVAADRKRDVGEDIGEVVLRGERLADSAVGRGGDATKQLDEDSPVLRGGASSLLASGDDDNQDISDLGDGTIVTSRRAGDPRPQSPPPNTAERQPIDFSLEEAAKSAKVAKSNDGNRDITNRGSSKDIAGRKLKAEDKSKTRSKVKKKGKKNVIDDLFAGFG
jgi:hypothetical protein